MLFLASLPLYPLIGFLIKSGDGGSVFYRGTRLGLRKRPFTILKFRTLPEGAEDLLGDSLLPQVNSMETSLGSFLRETRLDEIPQLWNVVRGEMHLVGPRPLRPSIHRQIDQAIPAIDRRFLVKPGLTGPAQFHTPYHTSMRLRSKLDCQYVNRKSLRVDAGLLISTLCHSGRFLARAMGRRLMGALTPEWRRLGGVTEDRRQLTRRLVSGSVLIPSLTAVANNGAPLLLVVPIHDLNEQAVSFTTEDTIPDQVPTLTLETRTRARSGGNGRRRLAACSGRVIRRMARQVVVRLTPRSGLDQYKLEKYFLGKAVADR